MIKKLLIVVVIFLSSCVNGIGFEDKRIETFNEPLPDGTIPHTTVSSKPIKVPKSLINNRVEAVAVVKYDVEKNGLPSNAKIVYSRPQGSLDQALLENMKTWVFKPAMKNGNKLITRNVISLSKFCLTNREVESASREPACDDDSEKLKIIDSLKENYVRSYEP